jgi:hypothetical protein
MHNIWIGKVPKLLAWTERGIRFLEKYLIISQKCIIAVNRAWNFRKYYLRLEATTNLFCKSSGMSVLVVFHCKLERSIRNCDLKVIEIIVLHNDISIISNGIQIKINIEPIKFSNIIWKKRGYNDDQHGKKLMTMNINGKKIEIYRSEINQRTS